MNSIQMFFEVFDTNQQLNSSSQFYCQATLADSFISAGVFDWSSLTTSSCCDLAGEYSTGCPVEGVITPIFITDIQQVWGQAKGRDFACAVVVAFN